MYINQTLPESVRNELQIYCRCSNNSSNNSITDESAFAIKYNDRNQAISQANDGAVEYYH